MSVPMKKPPTETVSVGGHRFKVPQKTAKALLVLLQGSLSEDKTRVPSQESKVIQKLDSQYTRAGACLQGARLKEGLSQVKLAKKVGIAQTNVSAMELGKRPIGKNMAKRLAKVLKVDYRIFL